MTSEYLTSAQVAHLFDVDVSTVSRWLSSGRIEGTRLGTGRTSALMFHRADVIEFGGDLRLLASGVV